MTDLNSLTDSQLVKLLEQIQQARKVALRPVLNYRARVREVKAEMARRAVQPKTGST